MIEMTAGVSAQWIPIYCDGSDGQEDELDDVRKGTLHPPTDDEGPGETWEKNKVDPDSVDTDSLQDSLRKAGLKPLP